ncbi:MAG TPA: chemotaxis response regulator protein-glutamate methylesterase [Terracidiphilus sp.]|nr:chemotaxis response regulator protein-glutamate methylesterase [Terracidiphilus sp.]
MAPERRKRILTVDDSAVMRSLLRSVLEPAFEVVGNAADGESALAAVEALRPDLVVLDVEMPVMDGLATLRKLRSLGHRLPVIMCSSLTRRGARVTIEALASGASDYVAKPESQSGPAAARRALASELLPKIRALTVPAQPVSSRALRSLPPAAEMVAPATAESISSAPSVVVVGVSTGGPAALDLLLPSFPRDFPLPILVVQHMPELFTRLLAERLSPRCLIPVKEAFEGAPVRPGCIAIARGNWHLETRSAGGAGQPPVLHLTQNPPENHCRPAVDVLFRSAAAVYGAGVLAVVLTGMGSDGLDGAQLIRAQGGTVLAQDQATSVIWGMPGAVVRAGLAQRVLPIQGIVPEILRLVSRARVEHKPMSAAVML